ISSLRYFLNAFVNFSINSASKSSRTLFLSTLLSTFSCSKSLSINIAPALIASLASTPLQAKYLANSSLLSCNILSADGFSLYGILIFATLK
ncbi:MAG: hypothetical protein QW808_03395, partial [Desulfurococcaceae archaeon]